MPFVGETMQQNEPLHLLAPDGILQVAFSQTLTADQALAVLTASQKARTIDELAESLKALGQTWDVNVATHIVSCSKRVTVMAPEAKPS